MIVKSVAMKAYQDALRVQQNAQAKIDANFKTKNESPNSFMQTLKGSLDKVNDLQEQKNSMVESFAAGKDQNVHELMITLQKAGLAMSMTSAVRSKILQSYQELTKMQF